MIVEALCQRLPSPPEFSKLLRHGESHVRSFCRLFDKLINMLSIGGVHIGEVHQLWDACRSALDVPRWSLTASMDIKSKYGIVGGRRVGSR